MAVTTHADQNPAMTQDDGTAVGDPRVRLWLGRRTRSEELRQLHDKRWSSYWDWYRSKVTPITDPTQWWRSNEYIPTPFKIVETVLPRYLLGMFEQPDWFNVEARNMRSEEYEQLCQQLLRTKLDQMKAFPKVYDAIKYCTIMGHVWGKLTWKEEWMRRKVMMPVDVQDPATGETVAGIEEETKKEQVFNGPQFDWLPLDKLWPDPSGRERWYIEQIDTTLEELQETQSYLNIYDPTALGLLAASLSGAPVPGGTYDAMGDARIGTGTAQYFANDKGADDEGIPTSTTAPQQDGIGVTLLQCWGWVPKELRGSDGAEWRLGVIANGEYVLRDVAAPTPDGKPPYFPVRSIRIPGRLYGESILYYVGPMADQQTRLSNMRLDEVFLGIWQSLLMRKGALASDNQMFFKPGGYMEVNVEPNQGLNDTVMVMPRAPLLPQVWQEDSYRQIQAEHAAAASDIMQGVGGSERQTATEVERKLQQGNARHVLQTMLFGYDFQKELLERTWEWLRMRMTKAEQVKMGEEYATIDLRNIQAPIDIVVGGGFFALSKATRLTMDQELVGLLQVPQFAEVAKPVPIFKQLLSDRGWKNVHRFVMTNQEYQQMKQQQMAAMALGQAVSEGASNGALNPVMASMGGMAPPGAESGGSAGPMPDMQAMGPEAQLAGQPSSNFPVEGNPLA